MNIRCTMRDACQTPKRSLANFGIHSGIWDQVCDNFMNVTFNILWNPHRTQYEKVLNKKKTSIAKEYSKTHWNIVVLTNISKQNKKKCLPWIILQYRQYFVVALLLIKNKSNYSNKKQSLYSLCPKESIIEIHFLPLLEYWMILSTFNVPLRYVPFIPFIDQRMIV
jgi:hypothetical protein